MGMMSRVLWPLVFYASSAFAAGGGTGVGQITDLLSPFVNFLIFLGILYWTLRGKIKNYFTQLGNNVVAIYERAQEEKRLADAKLSECEEKIKNLPQEKAQILRQVEKSASDFEIQYRDEIKDKIMKLKEDSQARIVAEETLLMNDLNRELVESVLTKTKNLFDQEDSLRAKAIKKLMKGIS